MRRRAIIVFAITIMITTMVTAFSYLYILQILRQRIASVSDQSFLLASIIGHTAIDAVPDFTSTRVDTNNPKQVKRAIEDYLRADRDLADAVKIGAEEYRYAEYVAYVDANRRPLVYSPEPAPQVLPERPGFDLFATARFRDQLRIIYGPPQVYDYLQPISLNDQPFGSVHIGISTVFFRSEIVPKLHHALWTSITSIFLSFILAGFISNIALEPLRTISRNLDDLSEGSAAVDDGESHDELGFISLKIANLGRQVRDAREIFSALKDNVDQLMANLQDGLMLFTRDTRVVLVSASVEKFLNRPRGELLGRRANEIFSESSPLGSFILESFRRGRSLGQREIPTAGGQTVQASLDFIQERATQIGALLILRDAESVRRIESEIEMSRRLSESSRVTRGVGHEFKNPINAIVLHLQLLQQKLQEVDPNTRRHMDVIESEIHRLNRLVQRLMDIYPRRELMLEPIDMRKLLRDVTLLAQPEAEQHGVGILLKLPEQPVPVKVDLDFMKQAVVNVVLNGIQAMPEGGTLTLRARASDQTVTVEIEDTGTGIPPEAQQKIFELYFTTKPEGSGIGLAQTYQILQWHYGAIDFETTQGKSTTFRLRLPLASRSGSDANSLADADPAALPHTR
jgi:signal transduction histidine kinase